MATTSKSTQKSVLVSLAFAFLFLPVFLLQQTKVCLCQYLRQFLESPRFSFHIFPARGLYFFQRVRYLQSFVSLRSQAVIGEEFHESQLFEPFHYSREFGDVFVRVVYAGDERRAHDDAEVVLGGIGAFNVFQYRPVVDSDQFFVFFRVGVFYVHMKQADVRQQRLYFSPRREEACFKGAVYAAFAAAAKYLQDEAALFERLSPADGEAPSGVEVEYFVFGDFFDRLRRRHGFSVWGYGRFGTDGGAFEAAGAFVSGMGYFIVFFAQRSVRARLYAAPAKGAFFAREAPFGGPALRFRRGAPEAAQGAAFEEEYGPQSVSIVDGAFFYAQDGSGHVSFFHCFSRRRRRFLSVRCAL